MISRATRSGTFLRQMVGPRVFGSSPKLIVQVGRGLRLSPETGKKDCLLLDIADACRRIGLHDELGLYGLDREEADIDDLPHLIPGLEKAPSLRDPKGFSGALDLHDAAMVANDTPFEHPMYRPSVEVDTKHSINAWVSRICIVDISHFAEPRAGAGRI